MVKKKEYKGALFSNSQAATAIHGQKVSLCNRRVEVVGTYKGALFSNSQAPTAIHGQKVSLRSRRVEVVGTRKNVRVRRRHAPCVSPSCASVLSFAHYFQAPAPQATRRFTKSGY